MIRYLSLVETIRTGTTALSGFDNTKQNSAKHLAID